MESALAYQAELIDGFMIPTETVSGSYYLISAHLKNLFTHGLSKKTKGGTIYCLGNRISSQDNLSGSQYKAPASFTDLLR